MTRFQVWLSSPRHDQLVECSWFALGNESIGSGYYISVRSGLISSNFHYSPNSPRSLHPWWLSHVVARCPTLSHIVPHCHCSTLSHVVPRCPMSCHCSVMGTLAEATCSCTDSQRDPPPFLEEVQSFPLGSDGTVIAVSDADGMLDSAWLEYAMPFI